MSRPCFLFVAVAAGVIAVHLATDPDTEPFFQNDETKHVMTGVFVHDAIHDLPASATHPKAYAVRYFAQYPALGLVTWPPFFYAVEGAVMAVGGPSYVTARVSVGLFALLAGWYLFRLVGRTHGPWAAALAVGLFGLSPLVYEYSRRVMLEVPALALVLAAAFHFERYLGEERRRDAWFACLFAAAAALTRFDGIVLLPYVLIRLAATRRFGLLGRRSVVWGITLALLLTAPYYLVTWKLYGSGIARAAGEGTRPEDTAFLDPRNLTYYPACLPDQVGWPVLVAAALGVFAGLRSRQLLGPYLALLAATYATFTPLAELEPRHTIYWVPAVAALAAVAVLTLAGRSRTLAIAAAAGLLIATGWDAASRPAWWVFGYGDAARYVTDHTSGERPVLIDGALNGAFTFGVRRADPSRRMWVLRGDKLFYTMLSDPRTSYTELAATEADVLAVLHRYDPELIVVEQPHLYFNLPGADLLREVLRKYPERFRLEHVVPLRSNHAGRFHGATLEVFRKLDRNPHPAREVEIPLAGLGGALRQRR